MRFVKAAFTASCVVLAGSVAAISSAQARAEPPGDAAQQIIQDVKRQRLEMNESVKRMQVDTDRLRHTTDSWLQNSAPSIPRIDRLSAIRPIDLQRTGFAGFRGAVKLQPLPKVSHDIRPLVSPGAVYAKAATEIVNLPVGPLADSVAPGAGTALSVGNLISNFRSAYLVGSGRATPSQLKSIIPHVVFACNRLGAPIDFSGTQNLEWATPLGHSSPGLSHRITGYSMNVDTRRDPLTDALITTSRTHMTTSFRMNGAEFNAFWNRHQNNLRMANPPRIQLLPPIQHMPRLQPMPRIQTYVPSVRSYSPPPRINYPR